MKNKDTFPFFFFFFFFFAQIIDCELSMRRFYDEYPQAKIRNK